MKNVKSSPGIVAALMAILFSIQTTHAVVTTWNNAAGGLWSVGGNWDTLNAPVAADDTRFVNVGGGATSTVDSSRTINSLVFAQDNQALHTVLINSGQTLTVSRANAGDVLNVGSTGGATTATTLTPATIQGAGGTLTISGTGNLVVRQGNAANGSHMATLDLSGVDTFNANVGRLLVGQANAGDPVNRPSGTLILAKTNHITLGGASPQLMLQDSGQNANTATSLLSLGQVTELFGDVMRFGGQKGNGTINFNNAFTAPSLKMRTSNAVDRVAIIDFGYNGAANSGNNTICVADFSTGIIDLQANLVNLAIGNPGASAGTCTSTLTIGAGTFDANTLEVGFGIATGANGAATATFNVNNNGLQSTGAVVLVNSTLRLARTNGGTGVVQGTININGGTVIASNIVSGGGVSTINVNAGGKLVVTGTGGSLAAPIRVFSMTDATLNIPAPNAGTTLAVSNLTVGGTQNIIKVTSIPPISSYPVTFNLIAYQSGAGGNFALAALPSASPSYAGTLIDVGGGVVALQLTAGPVVDLSMRWTGNTGNAWDSSSQNWLYQGNPTNFFSGAAALFNDNTAQNNIDLQEPLSPGSVTVSNNTLAFTFSGIGSIAGASSLTKRGSSSLTIDNVGANNFGSVTISAGTLQIGSGGVDGSISALNITNNGTFIVNRSGNLTLSSAITGTGTLTKSGDGVLTLSGANNYSGATILSGGQLRIDGTSGVGLLSTSNGTVLAGSGTINGAVTVRGQLNPGPIGGVGIFKPHNGLTLASGASLTFDLSANDYANPAANDSVEVFGNLSLNNNAITVNIAGTPLQGASYLLFTYTGTLSGSFNSVVQGTHFTAALDTTTPGSVYLNITGSSGSDLRWGAFTDNNWDTSTTNWFNLSSSAQSLFLAGDTVLFDDNSGATTVAIPSGTMFPALVTNSSTNSNYTINGAGRIGGGTSIVKNGTSTLILATANTFTGPVSVQEGTLQTDSDTALGTAAGGTTIENGATLNLNGRNLGGEVITVSGAGVSGQGAIINNGTTQNQALRQIVMTGDTTFGGSGLWAMNNGGGAASLTTGGSAYSLTKVGANQVNLAQVATIDAALADIDIQQGILEFSGLTVSMGDPSRTNRVHQGGTLGFANGTVAWNKYFSFDGDGVGNTVNVGTGANTDLVGPVEIHGNPIFNVTGNLLTISGVISGDGGLIKNGGSPMVLTNVNTYTGDTRINTAALRLSGIGSITNSPTITIVGGATLTVTGRVDATFTLVNGQVLKGNGVINGFVVESAGSTIAPGLDAIGALTVSNAITLSGTTSMELDAANGTNDVLRSNSTITYGGTLNLINLGGPLTSGSSFKLFYGSSYPGTFSSINPPTPGVGQTWDTSALSTTGTIKVSGGVSSPRITAFAQQGNNLILRGTNGVASQNYYVLATTNVALARSNWTRISTNAFDGSGNFNVTNAINPTIPVRFFTIQLP